jgi:transcriptional regulator with XRE-family HTH domain
MNSFAEQLREARKSHGLHQTELAELLSVHNSAVSKWERGKGTPSKAMKARVRELLNIEPPRPVDPLPEPEPPKPPVGPKPRSRFDFKRNALPTVCSCGASVDHTEPPSTYCWFCGCKLPQLHLCGAVVLPDDIFCHRCGGEVEGNLMLCSE